jgi:hypothetical protein
MASLAFAGMSSLGRPVEVNEKEGKFLANDHDKRKPGKPLPKIERAARPLTAKTTRSIWHGKKQPPTVHAETRQRTRWLARQSAKYGVPKSKRRPVYPGR